MLRQWSKKGPRRCHLRGCVPPRATISLHFSSNNMDPLDLTLLRPETLVRLGGGGTGGGGSATGSVALYFSAHFCPPCRRFTPVLAASYTPHELEVVFVSSDRSQGEFNEYAATMPWAAVPFSNTALRNFLQTKYGVSGIPKLVIVGADGFVRNADARDLATTHPETPAGVDDAHGG